MEAGSLMEQVKAMQWWECSGNSAAVLTCRSIDLAFWTIEVLALTLFQAVDLKDHTHTCKNHE